MRRSYRCLGNASPTFSSPSPHIDHHYSPCSGVHTVKLSRERALNSLTHEMISALSHVYGSIRSLASQHVDSVSPSSASAVILKGEGSKALSSGGDIVGITKFITEQKEKACPPSHEFPTAELFYTKYQVDNSITNFPIPTVSFIDGIAMGGGASLAIHGSHRLVSERATFAMPENAIGLFPDVGSSWFLPRVKPDGIGLFLALTGCRLKGADLVHAGVGTHFVPSELMPKVEEALVNEQGLKTAKDKKALVSEIVTGVVGDKKAEAAAFSLAPHLAQIAACFGEHVTSVEDVLAKLEADGSEWAMKQHKHLTEGTLSPTSLKLSFRLFREGMLSCSPQQCFVREYRAIQHCMEGHDFTAGVTALLIDKTGKPQWNPSSLEDVSDELVAKYMGPTSHGVEWDAHALYPNFEPSEYLFKAK